MLSFLTRPFGKLAELVEMLRWIGLRLNETILLLVLTLLATLVDGLGVGLIYPVLAFVSDGAAAFSATAPAPLPQVAQGIEQLGLPLTLPTLLGLVFIAFLLREGVGFLRASAVSRISNTRMSDLQARAAHAYIKADLPFHTATNRGALFASMTAECGQSAVLTQLTAEGLAQILLGAIYMAILFYLSADLTLMVIGTAVLALPLFRGQVAKLRAIGEEIVEANKWYSIRINEALQAIRLIKVRGQETPIAERIAQSCRAFTSGVWLRDRANAALDSLLRPLFMLCALAVFYVALVELNASLASLMTFIFVTTRLIPIITRLGVLRGVIPTYLQGPQRVRAAMEGADRQRAVVGGAHPFAGVGNGVYFDGVDFHYLGAKYRPVLSGVSFSVNEGETVAIVGPSGAGKSTVIDLLCRFYEPTGGKIVIAGRNLRDFELGSYRDQISLVSQEPIMFDDTIRANLEFGLQKPLTDDELRNVLSQAHCLDFVDALAGGVDTPIGERAVRLSGGQRQRLALARALANKPKLLLLDEPTSALDSMSERAIQETLRALHGKVTIIVVAHRLSTVIDADRILVLKDGGIVAEGTHTTLMGRGGVYSDLFRAQVSVAD